MKKMKVALIGVGDISNKYVDNLKQYPEIVEIVGCAARDYEKTVKRSMRCWLTRKSMLCSI